MDATVKAKTLPLKNTGGQKGSASQRNYEEIDTIRFITICFIIWGHCLLGWENRPTETFVEKSLETLVFQTGKVSTIIFFIVSGFLLRPKLQGYTLRSYFKERSPRVYFPWIFFIVLFQVISIIHFIPLREIWENKDIKQFVRLNYNILDGLLLYSAYWFITTYMISMVILVLFRKHAESLWLGAVLGSITLFYCVNLYYGWIEANHAKAVLGYAVFVWFGMQVNKYFDSIQSYLRKLPWFIVVSTVVLCFILACMEGYVLSEANCVDPYASNRFSNVLLSIVFFFALLKMGKSESINGLNPRKTVYGIYLVHNLLIFELKALILHFFSKQIDNISIWLFLLYQVVFFALILYLTYILVNWLANSRWRWVVGIR